MPDHLHLLIEPRFIEEADGIKPKADGIKPSAKQRKMKSLINNRSGDGFFLKCSGDGFIPSPIQNIIHDIKGKTAFVIRKKSEIFEKVWQKSFHDVQIYSDKFFEQRLNYIHNNPIRAGLVKNLDDYHWSSYQNYYLNNHSLIKID